MSMVPLPTALDSDCLYRPIIPSGSGDLNAIAVALRSSDLSPYPFSKFTEFVLPYDFGINFLLLLLA